MLEENVKMPVILARQEAKTLADYDEEVYNDRILIERAFGRLEDNRRSPHSPGFEERARSFEALAVYAPCEPCC